MQIGHILIKIPFKSSPLKPLNQITLNLAGMVLGWEWTIKISSPRFSILSLAAILVGSRDQRTQFWKGAIQESFQQSLVEIASVVSELCPLIPTSNQDGRQAQNRKTGG
jgi:hypothetical protein